MTTTGFLPITREEMEDRGITQPDFVYVTGDAYVDHPSFGHAIITRILEAHGYSVCIISQPDWKDEKSIRFSDAPGWDSWFPPETWIPWLIIILYPGNAGPPTPIRREGKPGKGPTMPLWSTAI